MRTVFGNLYLLPIPRSNSIYNSTQLKTKIKLTSILRFRPSARFWCGLQNSSHRTELLCRVPKSCLLSRTASYSCSPNESKQQPMFGPCFFVL